MPENFTAHSPVGASTTSLAPAVAVQHGVPAMVRNRVTVRFRLGLRVSVRVSVSVRVNVSVRVRVRVRVKTKG